MPKDACYRKVKARFAVFPSARASQAIAKCRKAHGQVRKGAAGRSLRRWSREKWQTPKGRPCGAKAAKGAYCRPTRRVSGATPRLRRSLSKSQLRRKAAEKRRVGPGRRVKAV